VGPDETLPTFENAPVVETVMSVQFDPLSKLTDAHLGGYWFERRNKWPKVQTQQPIDPVVESFDERGHWRQRGLAFQFGVRPEIRVQMLDKESGRLIQLQRDRFVFNWHRVGSGDDYPRFQRLREEFDAAFAEWKAFVQNGDLGEINPDVWEVVYVNHIPKGELWQTPNDWPAILPGLVSQQSLEVASTASEGFQGQWVYELTPRRGRLYVEVSPGRTTDKSSDDLLVLRLTARGPVKEAQSLDDGLNLGHRVIVQSFKNLTSPGAHQHWRLRDDARNT